MLQLGIGENINLTHAGSDQTQSPCLKELPPRHLPQTITRLPHNVLPLGILYTIYNYASFKRLVKQKTQVFKGVSRSLKITVGLVPC